MAEGVETREQLVRLRALGCDLVQGFLLHRPQSPADLTLLLEAATRRAASGLLSRS